MPRAERYQRESPVAEPRGSETQIKAYRDGVRQEPTMQAFVQTLTDQDAADLAAHFAGMSCQ
jgi:cytochrome c553